eukprot:9351884-Alexandrium_andersonii.AAC.1
MDNCAQKQACRTHSAHAVLTHRGADARRYTQARTHARKHDRNRNRNCAHAACTHTHAHA